MQTPCMCHLSRLRIYPGGCDHRQSKQSHSIARGERRLGDQGSNRKGIYKDQLVLQTSIYRPGAQGPYNNCSQSCHPAGSWLRGCFQLNIGSGATAHRCLWTIGSNASERDPGCQLVMDRQGAMLEVPRISLGALSLLSSQERPM